MVVNKPSIYIYVNHPNENVLREICSGIEEEGVFYEIIEREAQDLNALTWTAANDSMLGSGIGIKENSAAFIIRGLTIGKNLSYYAYPSNNSPLPYSLYANNISLPLCILDHYIN